ncbi:SET and MYND domain-containing protein 4 [Ochlerotatus camptorhynchus]|uniref:SET and MYND domain-containing protein 4 n=1 Tax=Ochlerotatus camptorhynchus TaxID=644619 RepID=UPI0031CFD090
MTLDAYDLYSALWRYIVVSGQQSQVVEGLKGCKTDGEIIAFVRCIVEKNDSDQFKLVGLEGDGKNEGKAIECRKSGNSHFHPKVKRYIKAVEHYNESIALSEERSENLAIVFANRSAVCFELKEYADCLQNIRLARENLYPEHLLPKLDKREEVCLKLLDIIEGQQIFEQLDQGEPKLSYKPNPKIPHISDCIELKEDEEFGRYLVTNRNLSAGDIIIVEKPFSTLLDANLRYTHCDYCHEDKFLTLIPCKTCTITMFCSEECRNKAWESYHHIECFVIKDMHFLFTKVIRVALRTVMTAISTFNYNFEELRLFIESIDERSLNPFKLDWTSIDSKQVYSTIHVLATNQKLRTTSDLVQRSVYAIIMSELLFRKTELGQLCDNNESHDLIRQLIFRHSQTSPVNMHSLMFMDYTPLQYEKFSQVNLACGSFPILSMINHSCAPNLVRMTLPNGHVVALLNRPIQKGGQLFDNYGFHHCLESLTERQSGLRGQYCFKCQCEACKLNYPLYPDLPHANLPARMKQPIDYDEMNQIGEHDMATALRKIPEYCHFLNTFDSQYPNYEISSVQEALLRCYQIVFSKQSRKLKYRDLCSF